MVMGALERLDPPRVLGDLTLLAALGEGGMATVYLAGVGVGPLARICAVKLLRANLPDHDYRTRFLDEARLVVRLHHNNIVDVRAAGEIGGQLYIAMEAIEGRDLADVWDRCAEVGRAFPVPLAVHVCREVLRGLHYAHTFPGLGLVHRDVSPSNVLLDWAGAVRLADFGLATSSLKASLTLPGVVFGKVGYMSPEQARHEPLDGRADVYAIAVILWELLTGRPLRSPEGMTTDTVSQFVAPAPATRSRRVDPELDRIVMKGLARDRDDRWPDANAMMLALNQWLAEHAPDMGQEKVSEFMRRLFGKAREVESAARADLLRELTGGGAIAGTQILDDDDADKDSRSSARSVVPVDEAERIEAGTVIADRYRVLSRLGRGGMGYVYLGEHLTVGRSVAIKVLTHEWSRSEAVATRFRAEARAASAAGHPNIIEVFDAGELDDGRLYLIMEFLSGRNLYEEVQKVGPLPVPRACHIMRDVGRAIRAAHEVGIIHRDLKPDNVMLAARGTDEGELVKVLDFGISASAERNVGEERLTNVGQALGTPEYMSPEQARGAEANEGFDIYALGIVFYELLTGDPPFHGQNMLEIIARKTTEEPPSVGSHRKGLPPALVELVDDCISLDIGRRPATAKLFLARLEDVLRALPRQGSGGAIHFEASTTQGERPLAVRLDATTTEDDGPPPADDRRGPRLPLVLFAGAAVLLLAAVGLFAFTGGRNTAQTDGSSNSASGTQARETGASGADTDPDTDSETDAGGSAGPGSVADARATDDGDTQATEDAGTEGTDTEGTDDGETDTGEAPQAHRTAACASVRDQADHAAETFEWDDVLRLTKQRECWRSRNERVALEVEALVELERFDRCVKVGRNHPSPKVQNWVKLCEKRK